MTDSEREKLIEAYRVQLELAPLREDKRHAELRMRELIAQRSRAQVHRMEQERGLR